MVFILRNIKKAKKLYFFAEEFCYAKQHAHQYNSSAFLTFKLNTKSTLLKRGCFFTI